MLNSCRIYARVKFCGCYFYPNIKCNHGLGIYNSLLPIPTAVSPFQLNHYKKNALEGTFKNCMWLGQQHQAIAWTYVYSSSAKSHFIHLGALPVSETRLKTIFLAATKQLYKWYFPSVRPSVRLSVRPSVCLSVTPFWLCSHHRIIMKFSGVITND